MITNDQLAGRVKSLLEKLKDQRLASESQIRGEMNGIREGEKQISYLEGLLDGRADARLYLNNLLIDLEARAADAITTS